MNKIRSVYLVDNQQLSINGSWSSHLLYHPGADKEGREVIELPYDVDFGVSLCKADENNGTTEAGGPWNFSKSKNARTFINELDEFQLEEGEQVEVGRYYRGHVDGSEEEYHKEDQKELSASLSSDKRNKIYYCPYRFHFFHSPRHSWRD